PSLPISFFFSFTILPPPSSTLFPLHDALPIYFFLLSEIRCLAFRPDAERDDDCARRAREENVVFANSADSGTDNFQFHLFGGKRSEEHTSELQSRSDLVCRLLLEKKKNYKN